MGAMHLALVAALAGSQGPGILRSGPLPDALKAPSRATWIPLDEQGPPVECVLEAPPGWACRSESPDAPGLVVIVDAQEGLVAFPVGLPKVNARPLPAQWGRLIRLAVSGVPSDALRSIKASGWRPQRSASRLKTRRFAAVEEPGVAVLRLSADAFWITGNAIDADAYVRFDGPAVASSRITLAGLQDGQPEFPVSVEIYPPVSILGQVVDEHGREVEDASVELWAPLRSEEERELNGPDKSFVRWAAARSDALGRFEFPGAGPGSYEIAADHTSAGRGTVSVASVADPVVVRLKAPQTAIGRVVRHGLAVEQARVRFVPNASALVASTDPTAHISDEVTTDMSGRFILPLPPVITGAVQIIAPDGTMARIPISATSSDSAVSLGDISMPDKRTVVLRLADSRNCQLNAAGPLGNPGLAMIASTREAPGLFLLQLPESGTWALDAQCDGLSYDTDPRVLFVPTDGPALFMDVILVPARALPP